MLRVYVKEKGSREKYPEVYEQIGMGTWMPSIRSLGTFEVAEESLAEAYVVPEETNPADKVIPVI